MNDIESRAREYLAEHSEYNEAPRMSFVTVDILPGFIGLNVKNILAMILILVMQELNFLQLKTFIKKLKIYFLILGLRVQKIVFMYATKPERK